ncbi:MAG: RsmB/NOP family class I SAM-dependent RNA methyltransferase [Nanoarchaeota archaeon]|nr:RsmB/NOP family class I SAM-dependent RNA methyltransferase [Nanoarchaeota archaeon]
MNFFLKRYGELGHDIDPDKVRLKQSIRVNTLKISEELLVSRLKAKKMKLRKIPFTDSGYWVESDFALSSTPEYLHGYYYIQEAASQLPVQALSPEKGELVLDMCAAPGSKTTQLAQYMRNQGRIVALDSSASRLSALKNNLERCGVKDCIVYQKDAAHVQDLGLMFDKILLDAPCSGNFTTDPGWFEKRSPEGVRLMAKAQKSLLQAAIAVLKPSGTLVYSTCSLEPEENEEVIEWALDNLSIKLVPTGLEMGDPGISKSTELCRRFWPEKTQTQGFFVAKMQLKG